MWIPVRDYVVHDIIETNRTRAAARPVFFAVTIPRDNMARYFPFLQMEGLAYRLTETREDDGMPDTDPDRLLANVLGAYELGSVITGDDDARHARFLELVDSTAERPRAQLLAEAADGGTVDWRALLDLVGHDRDDVYRNPSTENLLGNYPASIARAGFTYLTRAEELRAADGTLAAADTLLYDSHTRNATAAYELALRFDPDNSLVAAGYYPALLVEQGRLDSALSYMSRIRGRFTPDVEETALLAGLRSFVALGENDMALAWIERELQLDPRWRLGYEIAFRIHEAAGDVGRAAAVADRWREVSGRDDPAMREQLRRMRERGRDQEREGVERAIRERGLLPEDPR